MGLQFSGPINKILISSYLFLKMNRLKNSEDSESEIPRPIHQLGKGQSLCQPKFSSVPELTVAFFTI